MCTRQLSPLFAQILLTPITCLIPFFSPPRFFSLPSLIACLLHTLSTSFTFIRCYISFFSVALSFITLLTLPPLFILLYFFRSSFLPFLSSSFRFISFLSFHFSHFNSNMGNTYKELQQIDEAISCYKTAIKVGNRFK